MTPEEERVHWDSVSGDAPHTMIRFGDWDKSIAFDLGELIELGQAEGPILDLGCGVGRLACAYARRQKVDVIGVDISARMLDRAELHRRVRYMLGNGRDLPDDLPELGGAFSMGMFQHIPKAAQKHYIAQVAEKLRPGARFIFQTVLGDDADALSHQVSVTEPPDWAWSAGFEVESVRKGLFPEWLWVTARKP